MAEEQTYTTIPLGKSHWKRTFAQEPTILVHNRYFESAPINQVDEVTFIARPGMDPWKVVGDPPNRAIYSQPGSFGNDLFIVQYDTLYRINQVTGAVTTIGSGIYVGDIGIKIAMAATGNIGSTPEYLFLADGRNLWVYDKSIPSFEIVETPDDVGVSDVAYTNDYVIVVPAQEQGVNGRFYWIEPGEKIIDPLNFATAERAPDPIIQSIAVGDQFWLFGSASTEIWYPTGDANAPFQRVQGRLFERGIWGGTAVQIKDAVVVVGDDGRVYSVSDGPKPISTPAIEEEIRKAIRIQQSYSLV